MYSIGISEVEFYKSNDDSNGSLFERIHIEENIDDIIYSNFPYHNTDKEEKSEEHLQNPYEREPYKKNDDDSISKTINNTKDFNVIICNTFPFNKADKKEKIKEVFLSPHISESSKDNSGIQFAHKKRIRSKIPRKRKELQDNIRKKIKTRFFNNFIRLRLERELKLCKSKHYFEKYPTDFVSDIDRKRNKPFLDMTLVQIMKKKDIYGSKYEGKYKHNLKVLDSLKDGDGKNYLLLEKTLNTTYSDLFEEYINSNEFAYNLEQLKIKENGMYVERYEYLSKTWIEFFYDSI